jgi:hypothetical protein
VSLGDSNSFLFKNRSEIDVIFSKQSIEEVLSTLRQSRTAFRRETLKSLVPRCSPLSLKATFKAIQFGKEFDSVSQALRMELRLCTRVVLEYPEFSIGVKSVMSKTGPVWSYNEVSEIEDTVLERIFAPFEDADMELQLSKSLQAVQASL